MEGTCGTLEHWWKEVDTTGLALIHYMLKSNYEGLCNGFIKLKKQKAKR